MKTEDDNYWQPVYKQHLRRNNLLAQENKLQILAAELLRWNKTHNLTAYTSLSQVMTGLILDSLMLAPYCRGDSCLDIGSGAGFPGLVLALVFPHMQVTLLDGRRKRVSFQQYISHKLGLSNLIALNGRAGEARDPLAGRKFATVTCKALASLPLALRLCRFYLARSGIILLPRGLEDEKTIAALPENTCPDMVFSSHYYTLPGFIGQRIILSVEFLPDIKTGAGREQ
jgi:16S rRNA (guanine527-N7)-methyltransferase